MIAGPTLPVARLAAAALTAVVLLMLGLAADARASATYSGSSADGSKVFFSTLEQILPSADPDAKTDIYQRTGGTTSLVSWGLLGTGPFDSIYEGASADGSRVYFKTDERLVAADPDDNFDVYVRAGGSTILLSTGPGAGADLGADFLAAAEDGNRVVFATAESLDPADTDSVGDLYSRVGSTTTLLSGGSAEIGVIGSREGISVDASIVYFVTSESLLAEDTDDAVDVYRSSAGALTLVSTGPTDSSSETNAAFGIVSDDGAYAFYETAESLVAEDVDDGATDVYGHGPSGTFLVSGGGGAADAGLVGASADGQHAYFTTVETLVAADSDSLQDLYERTGGQVLLVSTSDTPAGGEIPEFVGASADGSRSFFTTAESLVPADGDLTQDIYMRSGNTTGLISTGPVSGTSADMTFDAVSTDGTEVLFTTAERLVSADGDDSRDVYLRADGTTTLVSTGPEADGGEIDASAGGGAQPPDLSKAFIETTEHLTDDDTDGPGDSDVFEWSAGTLVLVSGGGQTTTTPASPSVVSFNPASPSADETPLVIGSVPAGTIPGTIIRLYLNAECKNTPVGAGTAAEFQNPGIEIQVPENAESAVYASATDADGNSGPCSQGKPYEEDSTAPGAPSIGGTNPASPANNNFPKVFGGAVANTTIRIYASNDCSGGELVSGTQIAFGTPGLEISVADDSTTALSATATDIAGNESECSASIDFVEETAAKSAPVLTLDPASPADDNEVVVKGAAAPGTTVRLYRGTGPVDCTGTAEATVPAAQLASPGITVNVPDDTQTTFRATATSPAGNTSPCSAPVTYIEDSTGPATPTLTLGSPARSNDNRVVVRGQAAGLTVALFRGPNCQSTAVATGTVEQLSVGITLPVADNSQIELHAVAVDRAHNPSTCSAPVTYTEDSTAPKTRITFGPAFKTRDRTPTFRFRDESQDPTAWFQCKVDRKKFRRCSSPKTFKGLKPGRHTIQVRARDGAGNKESRAVKRRIRIVR